MNRRKTVALVLIVLMANLPVLSTGTPIGKALPGTGASTLNGTHLKLETTLFSGDTLATKADALVVVQLSRGDQVHIGPSSLVTLREGTGGVVLAMASGMAMVRSGRAQDVLVNAAGLVVRPQEPAIYEVYLTEGGVYVVSKEGKVEVAGTNRSFTVEPGQAMRFGVDTAKTQGPVGRGAHSLGPVGAIIVATVISLGVAIPVGFVVAQNKVDDAEARLNQQISALQTQITTLQQQVTTLTQQGTTQQGQITALQTQITTLQGQVTTLQTQLTAAQQQFATQLAALQTQLTTLQNQLTQVCQALQTVSPTTPCP